MLVRWSQSYFVAMLLGVGLIASSCAEGGVDPLASPCDPGDTECVDTKPSNSGSGESLCGNGMPDPGEECDSDNVGRRSCEEQGLVGQVSCDANCRIDFSTCTMPEVDPCGNGQLDAGEDCDGANLNGMTCVSLGAGFVSGDLACGADCSFDSSRCVFQVVDPCGNGRLDMGETCDDLNQIGGDGCDDFCQAGQKIALNGASGTFAFDAASGDIDVQRNIVLWCFSGEGFVEKDVIYDGKNYTAGYCGDAPPEDPMMEESE